MLHSIFTKPEDVILRYDHSGLTGCLGLMNAATLCQLAAPLMLPVHVVVVSAEALGVLVSEEE